MKRMPLFLFLVCTLFSYAQAQVLHDTKTGASLPSFGPGWMKAQTGVNDGDSAGSSMGRSRAAGKALRVRLGKEFDLRVGQQAAVEGRRFTVRFQSVGNDSRCPVDVTCVWAGNAEVLIEAEANRSRANLTLNTQGGTRFPNVGRHGQFSVELVKLIPAPRESSGNKVPHYVATLVIRNQ
jgi:hypothetical protein